MVAGAAGSSSLTVFRIGTDGVPVAVDHVFDELAIVAIQAPTIPASGLTNAQVMNGRTVTASLRYAF